MKTATSSPALTTATLDLSLSNANYLRMRTAPGIFDLDYPHLKDLLDLMRSVADTAKGDVFDYGCGGAPYRGLFTGCRSYVAADIGPGPGVDRVLKEDGLTGEPDASYDLILSTQVLEHVEDPERYLWECHRILRPGGQVILTTHGMFEEHGCPFDFHRWTSQGIERLFKRCGFAVVESSKLTTGHRAMIQLLNRMSRHLEYPEKRPIHLFLRIVRRMYRVFALPTLNWLSGFAPEQARVPGSHSVSFYTCVYVRASKSEDK